MTIIPETNYKQPKLYPSFSLNILIFFRFKGKAVIYQ